MSKYEQMVGEGHEGSVEKTRARCGKLISSVRISFYFDILIIKFQKFKHIMVLEQEGA